MQKTMNYWISALIFLNTVAFSKIFVPRMCLVDLNLLFLSDQYVRGINVTRLSASHINTHTSVSNDLCIVGHRQAVRFCTCFSLSRDSSRLWAIALYCSMLEVTALRLSASSSARLSARRRRLCRSSLSWSEPCKPKSRKKQWHNWVI